MSYRVLRGLPCPRFCKRQSVSCCLKSRECPFLSKESVSPERLHLFSLFFSALTFLNLGKEVCRSVVSRHDLGIPRWSAPCCGDTLSYCSAAMFFLLRPRPQGSGRQHGGCLPSARRVPGPGTSGGKPCPSLSYVFPFSFPPFFFFLSGRLSAGFDEVFGQDSELGIEAFGEVAGVVEAYFVAHFVDFAVAGLQ